MTLTADEKKLVETLQEISAFDAPLRKDLRPLAQDCLAFITRLDTENTQLEARVRELNEIIEGRDYARDRD